MSSSTALPTSPSSEERNISFIDESGSSCASSTIGDGDPYRNEYYDTNSLNIILDDAASSEFDFTDVGTLSCGYASLDRRSDTNLCDDDRNDAIDDIDFQFTTEGVEPYAIPVVPIAGSSVPLAYNSMYGDSQVKNDGVASFCPKGKYDTFLSTCSEPIEMERSPISNAPLATGEVTPIVDVNNVYSGCKAQIGDSSQPSSSSQSSPRSRRTSQSSIKSSDALDDDVKGSDNPLFPLILPPRRICEDSSCYSSCSNSSMRSSSSARSSCTRSCAISNSDYHKHYRDSGLKLCSMEGRGDRSCSACLSTSSSGFSCTGCHTGAKSPNDANGVRGCEMHNSTKEDCDQVDGKVDCSCCRDESRRKFNKLCFECSVKLQNLRIVQNEVMSVNMLTSMKCQTKECVNNDKLNEVVDSQKKTSVNLCRGSSMIVQPVKRTALHRSERVKVRRSLIDEKNFLNAKKINDNNDNEDDVFPGEVNCFKCGVPTVNKKLEVRRNRNSNPIHLCCRCSRERLKFVNMGSQDPNLSKFDIKVPYIRPLVDVSTHQRASSVSLPIVSYVQTLVQETLLPFHSQRELAANGPQAHRKYKNGSISEDNEGRPLDKRKLETISDDTGSKASITCAGISLDGGQPGGVQSSGSRSESVSSATIVQSHGEIGCGRQTPDTLMEMQDVKTPTSNLSIPLKSSTPNHPMLPPLTAHSPTVSFSSDTPSSPDHLTNPNAPHHYISSLKVASMKGAADMGGALVARVATFLRSQYKSLVTSPVSLPWCHRFKLSVSDFESTLVQIPLAPHHKVPAGQVGIESLLKPQVQITFPDSSLGDRPRRVLVEGDPGYSLGHVCYRMAYDWSTTPPAEYMQSFSLVFVLTLRDFRGGNLFTYMCKEVLPRHILSREAMNTLWAHIKKIEDKVLFLLVGYDELCPDEVGDLQELIDGQLFPEVNVVITSRFCHAIVASSSQQTNVPFRLPANLHRRYINTGFDREQMHNFLEKFFDHLGKPEPVSEAKLLSTAIGDRYGNLIQCPLMCLAMGTLYEDLGGKLPLRLTDFFMGLLKHMTRKNLQRRGEPMCYDVLPEKYNKLLQDFGKMSLEALKSQNPYFNGSDLKVKIQHGSETVSLGILMKLRSMSKLNKRDNYAPVHITILEFLAAFYLSSLVHSYSQMQTELDSLVEMLDINGISSSLGSCLMILRYLVGILGRNANLVFNIVTQMGVSNRVIFTLMQESGMAQMNVIEVCKHLSCRDPITIQTNSFELDAWGCLMYSQDCTLENVEVLMDFDGSSKESQEVFFNCLSFNESIKGIKLICLIGGEFGENEVTRLVSYVRSVLTKRRLESFELQVTSLEELTSSDVLIPVLDMICDTLPEHAQSLTRIVLAMELECDQVVRLCSVLCCCPHVTVLHLPHLACGLTGLKAVAGLVSKNPLMSLNLSGSLSNGTPVDDRSAANEGSSISREESLAFWSFTDVHGNSKAVFNSLPRSFYQSLPRRGRLNSLDKRNSESLPQKAFPPPLCSPTIHSNGFHEIFSAFRDPECRVCHLNISKCSLGAEDLVCLGQTVKMSKCLSSLRMEGVSRMAELIPVLIGLQDSSSLQLLDLTSPHILLGDAAFQLTLATLSKNKSLRFLVLNGWTLQLESERSLNDLVHFLSTSELKHFDVSGCRVEVTIHDGPLANISRQDDIVALLQGSVPALSNSVLAFLNMDNFEVNLNGKVTLRGPQLFFLLKYLPKLVDLSLSSKLGPDIIDNAMASKIFALIPSALPCLRRLNIAGWVFSLDNCEKVLRSCGKHLRNSQIREVHLDGIQVRESSGKVEMEHHLLSAFTSNLYHLSVLSLQGATLSSSQTLAFGKTLREKLLPQELRLETKGLSYSSIKSLRQSLIEGKKFLWKFDGGNAGVYHISKVFRKDRMLSKWACMTGGERETEDF